MGQKGIQLPPFVDDVSQMNLLSQMIQSYLNSGVDIVHENGLKDHGLVWGPKTPQGDKLMIACGRIRVDNTTPATLIIAKAWYDGRAEALSSTLLEASSFLGDPRFIQQPTVFAQRAWTTGDIAINETIDIAINETVIDTKEGIAIQCYLPDSPVENLTLYWFAIGMGRGEE